MERSDAEAILISYGFDSRYLESNARHFFLQACRNGPTELIEAFLVCGMSIRATTDREPPIIKAAESGSLAHVELVQRYGGDLATRDIVGDTALHTAANWGHATLIGELAALGASADTHNDKNWTPLTKAVKDKKTEIVRALLAAGADPDFAPKSSGGGRRPEAKPEVAAPSPKTSGTKPSGGGRRPEAKPEVAAPRPKTSGMKPSISPLAFAKDEMIAILLEAGASADVQYTDATGDTLLLVHVARKNEAVVRALLEHGAVDRPNAAGWTAHMIASDPVREIPASMVALLEAHGAVAGDHPDTRLHAACSAGNLAEVQRLLAAGHPIDRVNRAGSTPLLVACTKSQWEVARWLLEQGADPGIANVYANAPITFATQEGSAEMVRALLAAGAPANEGTPHGGDAPRSLALTIAGSRGFTEIARQLVDAGADLASRDKFEQTAVFLAASKGHPATLRALLEMGGDPNVGGRASTSPLLIAQGSDRAACVAILVEAGADLEHEASFGRTALHRACDKYRNTKDEPRQIAEALLDAGADFEKLDAFGNSPLDLAVQTKNAPVREMLEVRFTSGLLEKHTRRGATDWAGVLAEVTPEHLKAFVRSGDLATIDALLEHGLDVGLLTWGPRPVLQLAIRQEDPAMAERMLAAGADPHWTDKGETLLMTAAGSAHLGLVEHLLEAGVDVQSLTHDYPSSALSRAASKDLSVVDRLLSAGAEVDPVRGGWSPLMRAAQAGKLEIVERLLEHGANPNLCNSQRQTPLEVARKNQKKHGTRSEALIARLSEVSDIDMPDREGRTPLLRAAMKGDLATVATLLDAGADASVQDGAGDTPASVGALRADVAKLLGTAHAPLQVGRMPHTEGEDPFRALRRRAQEELPAPDARNGRGDTALHLAVLLGDREMVEALIAAGADVHAENEVGDTPWSLAITVASSLEEPLRTAGAKIDVNKQVVTGGALSDLRAAFGAGDLRDVVRRLETKTVNPHLLGPWQTPLELALADPPMLEVLLTLGCDPLTPRTSLYVQAARRGERATLRMLFARNVEVDAPTLSKALLESLRRGAATATVMLEGGAELESIDIDELYDQEELRTFVDIAFGTGQTDLATQANARLRHVLSRLA